MSIILFTKCSCDFFKYERKLYLKPYFYAKRNILKYKGLLTSNSDTTLIKVSKSVDIFMKQFASWLRREIIPVHSSWISFQFYCNYVFCHFNHIVENVLSDQFRKIIICCKRIGYNINIMRQSACLVFNPITVNNFASLFNCQWVGRQTQWWPRHKAIYFSWLGP